MKKILPALTLIVTLVACNAPLNSELPDYLKQLAVYREGDGIFIYFVLADKAGQMTTCDGDVSIAVRASRYGSDEELKLFDKNIQVKKESFVKGKVGAGAFQHEAVLCPIGRISFQSFTYEAGSLKEANFRGKVI